MKRTISRKIIVAMVIVGMFVMTWSTLVGATSSDTSGTLYIKNAYQTTSITLSGKTIYGYEIFNYHIVDDISVKYDVQSEFEAFFLGKLNASITDGGTPWDISDYNTDAFNTAAMEYIEAIDSSTTSETMQDFAQDLIDWIADQATQGNTITVDCTIGSSGQQEINTSEGITVSTIVKSSTEEVITVTGIEPGYYLFVDGSPTGENSILAAAIDTIPQVVVETDDSFTYEDVTINVKGSQPTINKEVWHNDVLDPEGVDNSPTYGSNGSWDTVADYEIGDIIEYRITATIPSDITGYEYYTYIIEDTLPDGVVLYDDPADDYEMVQLFLDAKLTTKVAGNNHTTTYGTDTTSYDWQIVVDMAGVKAALPNQTDVYIYFKGIVTDKAEAYDSSEVNWVSLTYSNDPYDSSQANGSTHTTTDYVDTYTFDLDVTKTIGNGVTPLEGVTFALYSRENEGDDYQLVYLALDTSNANGNTYVISASGTVDLTSKAGTVTTDSTGKFTILGLDDEVAYRIVEVETPTGYNGADDVDFKIHADYSATDTKSVVTVSSSGVVANNNDLTLTIVNTSNQLLPDTGGIGTTIFLVVGGSMMLVAGVLLIGKRRRSKIA